MKKVLTVILLLASIIFCSCMDRGNEKSFVANGYSDAKKFDLFWLMPTTHTVDSTFLDSHPYAKFHISSQTSAPYYIDKEAKNKREISIGEKTLLLEYSKTVLTRNYIADQYVSSEHADVFFRFYRGTNILAEILSVKDVLSDDGNVRSVSKIPLKDLFPECVDEENLEEYSKSIASLLGISLDGLVCNEYPIIDAEFTQSDIYEEIELPEDKKDSVAFTAIQWSKKYSNGITMTQFEIQYSTAEDNKGIISIHSIPQAPDGVFEISDEDIRALVISDDHGLDKTAEYKHIEKEYVILCNNVVALEVKLIDFDIHGCVNSSVKYYVFPQEADIPVIDGEVIIDEKYMKFYGGINPYVKN